MPTYAFRQGRTPLLVSMPHVGLDIPDDIAGRLTGDALMRPDTDWHIDLLYDFLERAGASAISATCSRYVVDLNRAPDGAELYPGANATELCPTTSFANRPLYRDGQQPDGDEIARRVELYWRPYHAALAAELDRLKDAHGVAVLWDAHSIRSVVPRFFEGVLADFNFGTAGGDSCDPDLAARLMAIAGSAEGYSATLDGRFKGGYITRHYGRPGDGVHAVQLELSQRTYMDEDPPFAFRADLADAIRPTLRRLTGSIPPWASVRPGN
jgi:N-formylglutamate deformylase